MKIKLSMNLRKIGEYGTQSCGLLIWDELGTKGKEGCNIERDHDTLWQKVVNLNRLRSASENLPRSPMDHVEGEGLEINNCLVEISPK